VFLINNKHSSFDIFDATNSTLNSPRITSNTPTNEHNPTYDNNEDDINENFEDNNDTNGMGSS
jgi:hypothetical protein